MAGNTIDLDPNKVRDHLLEMRGPSGLTSAAFGVATPPNEDVAEARKLGVGVRAYQEYRRQEVALALSGSKEIGPMAKRELANSQLQRDLKMDDAAFRHLMESQSIHDTAIENKEPVPRQSPVMQAQMAQMAPPSADKPEIGFFTPKKPELH